MDARKILRYIYLLNHRSKSILDLDKKKKAFDYFGQFKTKPKRSFDDEIINDDNSFNSNKRLLEYLKMNFRKVK
jgi:hypothetical protein